MNWHRTWMKAAWNGFTSMIAILVTVVTAALMEPQVVDWLMAQFPRLAPILGVLAAIIAKALLDYQKHGARP